MYFITYNIRLVLLGIHSGSSLNTYIINVHGTVETLLRARRLGPLHVENQVVVAKSVQRGDGLSRIILFVVIDECEAFTLVGYFVLGQEDACDVPERLEQLLQV